MKKDTLFEQLQRDTITAVSARLTEILPKTASPKLNTAIEYAIGNKGKMVRASIVFATAKMFNINNQAAIIDIATSIELIHLYSLIHDDLPAMDDDDLRRGRATVHKKFDEATAILVGDCLQTMAYELLSAQTTIEPVKTLNIINYLAKASGSNGLIAGQMLDLFQTEVDLQYLQTMHQCKTGALFEASIIMPYLLIEDSTEYIETLQVTTLQQLAKAIGLAFQIADDILDVEKTTAELGKPAHSDESNNTITYLSLLGSKQARLEFTNKIKTAMQLLSSFDNNDYLVSIVEYINSSIK